MALLGGDKNSPKTSQQSASTTKNTSIQPTITAGANSATSVGPVLSDVTNTGKISISTTDQGAVAAGLTLGLKALDATQSATKSAIDASTTALEAGNQAQDAAINVAQGVANGQQNTSLKYILYGVVAIAAIAGFAYVYRKG